MPSSPTGTTGPTGTSGTTGPAVNTNLPAPPTGAGHNWQSAYAAYQANPTAGYAAYYNFLAAGKTSAPMLAAGHFPAPGTPGAPTGTTGATGTSGPAGTSGPSNVPLHNNDPNVLGLYNRDPNWLSNFVTPGTAFGATGPATNPTPTGGTGTTGSAGTTGGFGPPGTTVPGGGTPHEGNAGGASHGVGGGGAGDNAGHPGAGNASGGNSPGLAARNSLMDSSDGQWHAGDLANLGSLGSNALGAAAMFAPGYGGMAASVAQLALRGYNLYAINQMREQQGLPPLDAGQIAGGLSALNQYGNLGGGNTIAEPGQFTDRVNQQIYSLYDNNPNFFGAPSTFSPGSVAETSDGSDYYNGPQGILGWAMRGLGLVDDKPTPAWAERNASGFLGGPGSFGSTATGDMGARGIAPAKPAGPVLNPKTDMGRGYAGSSNEVMGAGSNGGAGSMSPGGGSGRESGGADPGGAWGGADARGDHMAEGGPVPGNALIGDNVPVRATPGEFMLNRQSASELGPNNLHMLNDPKMAGWLAQEMAKFSQDARGEQPKERKPAGGPVDSKYGDPHLPDAFIDAIMHPQHAARLAALHKSGWSKSWA